MSVLCFELKKMIGGIAQRWRLLSGHNNWTNLLKPLDSDLQRYLLHYGGMAQATNDAFDFDILSKYIGYSKFSRKHLFERCGLVKGNPFRYKAVKYIYATSGPGISLPESFILKPLSEKTWYKESNWMGYIAVATDEGKAALGRRDILIAWRGTIMPIEWEKDFEFPLVPASKILGKCGGSNAHVHQGFLSIYTATNPRSKYSKTSARDQVLSELKKLIEQYKHEELSITLTGHSLGGALSTLCATDIVCNGYNKICHNPYKTCPVTAFRYGAPMVGDSNFKHTAESMNDLHMLSIHNVPDIVPKSPAMPGYTRVGQEHFVDSKKSPYLTFPGDTYTWHNLEGAYLHSLAIENGGEPKRDLALVNKGSGALKPKYGIPFSWWCEENKGMVQKSDGSWQLRDYEGDE